MRLKRISSNVGSQAARNIPTTGPLNPPDALQSRSIPKQKLPVQKLPVQTAADGPMNPSMRSSHKATVSKASDRANRPSDAL